jgi:hypothetical protein
MNRLSVTMMHIQNKIRLAILDLGKKAKKLFFGTPADAFSPIWRILVHFRLPIVLVALDQSSVLSFMKKKMVLYVKLGENGRKLYFLGDFFCHFLQNINTKPTFFRKHKTEL